MSRFNVSNANSILELQKIYKNDFFYLSTLGPWIGMAVQSGTHAVGIGTVKHPGIIQQKSSASANSGYRYSTDYNSILLGGGEKTTIIFKTAPVLTTVITRMGFHDSSSEAPPKDGVYVKIANTTLTGQTMNNTAGSTTSSNYSVSADTWYRVVIELNAAATLANFTLYADDSDNVLWTDTLATNIPTATGRTLGSVVISLSIGTEAIVVGEVDYIDMVLPNARKVI